MRLPQSPARRSRKSAVAHTAAFWSTYLLIIFVMGRVKVIVPEPLQSLIWGLTSSALILMTTRVFLSRENRTFRDIGLMVERTTILRLLWGLGVGVLVFGLIVLVVASLTSDFRFERSVSPSLAALFFIFGGTLATSCMEELGFRAYSLRVLLEGLSAWMAHLIVALAFGVCHIAFGWSWNNVFFGVIPSAFLFGMAAVATRGLAVPIGIHAGLNIAQWSIGKNGLWRTVSDPLAAESISRIASIAGIGITLLAAFLFWLRIPKDSGAEIQCIQAPNKAPEPTPGAVTPRATEGTSK